MLENKKERVVIYGLGKLAQYISFMFENDSEIEVVAYTVESGFLPETNPFEDKKKVVEFETIQNEFSPENVKLFVAVGDNQARARVFKEVKAKGYEMASFISSNAIVWKDLDIGENVFISEDTGIQPFVKIGNNNILIGPRVGHHCQIGNHCLLSCCYLAGDVRIGDEVFVGLNATVKQGVKVADHNIIGMGCSIVSDTENGDIYTTTKTTIKREVKFSQVAGKYLS